MFEKEKLAERLRLTPEQENAFRKLQQALLKCEKLNIKLIGFDELHYAVNGNNLLNVRMNTGQLDSDEILFNSVECESPMIAITEPWVSVSVALKVKT